MKLIGLMEIIKISNFQDKFENPWISSLFLIRSIEIVTKKSKR